MFVLFPSVARDFKAGLLAMFGLCTGIAFYAMIGPGIFEPP
jgi:threonine/homoserine/homoserine lactone efflux protein